MSVRFSLDAHEPGLDPGPVLVLATRPPGSWQQRVRARRLEDGSYAADVQPDLPGAYYVSVAVPSLGADFTSLPFTTFRAVRAEPEATAQ